jgi:plastocyanin
MDRSRPRTALLATLVALALALAACGSSSATGAPTTAPVASAAASSAPSPASGGGGGGTAVTIKDFAFSPATLEVPVGATVTWANQDSTAHTVTADDGSFDSKSLASGQGFSQAFSTAGTFTYHCSIHSSMMATITVK